MKTRRHLLIAAVLVLAAARLAPPARSTVPDSLTNDEFWTLSQDLSESGGTFRSDNLLSNERMMQHVIPGLQRAVRPRSAYLGVGPEQNFTYIAALKPSIAFIIDIRRGNLQVHLMYKALFELSADRVDFVSKLFSRPRPDSIGAAPSAADLFAAFATVEGSPQLFAENLVAMRKALTSVRKLELTEADLLGIEWIYQTFYSYGPMIQYRANFGGAGNYATYAELMTGTDASGMQRSFLATPDAFDFVKQLQSRNLIVPVVGDFAGPKALRSVGRYLKDRGAVVGAFYLSNVEQYLGREGRLTIFCENVAALPLNETSSFIRSIRDGTYGRGVGLNSITAGMLAETGGCAK
jgi:hypothetical protein